MTLNEINASVSDSESLICKCTVLNLAEQHKHRRLVHYIFQIMNIDFLATITVKFKGNLQYYIPYF